MAGLPTASRSREMGTKSRELVPVHSFGVNGKLSRPVIPLAADELTYICCVESRLAFVSAEERENGASAGIRSMQFFPSKHLVESVTALGMHDGRKLLAVCASRLEEAPACRAVLVYGMGQFNGAWVPSVLQTLRDPGEANFQSVAFSPDSKTLTCCSTNPTNEAVGFEWKSGETLFRVALGASAWTIVYHPHDALELSTSGPGHLQLWRYLHKQLKPKPAVVGLSENDPEVFATHAWLETEALVAGTRTGCVLVVQQNEVTSRFDEAHPNSASVRAVLPLEAGFATICEAGVASVFATAVLKEAASCSAPTPKDTKPRVSTQLTRRLTLGDATGVYFAAPFPRSSTSVACCRDGTYLLDLGGLTLVAPGPDLKRVSIPRVDCLTHSTPILAVSCARAKPLTASCGSAPNCIKVWDWSARKCYASFAGDELVQQKVLVGLDLHPSGNSLLAAFLDDVFVFRVTKGDLSLAQAVPIRGVVKLANDDTPLVATAPVRFVKYSRAGHLFATVTGRLVLVHAAAGPSTPKKATLLHCLRGHAKDIVDLAWAVDDMRLWTAAEDGAVYEWLVGNAADYGKIVRRCRECVDVDVVWTALDAFGTVSPLVVAAGRRGGCLATSPCCGSSSSSSEDKKAGILRVFGAAALADGAKSTDLDLGADVATRVLAVDATSTLEGMVLVGTERGAVRMYPKIESPGERDTKSTNAALWAPTRIAAVCDGPVRCLSYAVEAECLCAASENGSTLLVCTLSAKTAFEKPDLSIAAAAETVLLDAQKYAALRDRVASLTRQLEQARLQCQKAADDMMPAFKREHDELKRRFTARVESRDREIEERKKELDAERDAHRDQLDDIRKKFDDQLVEIEVLYDKKLAIEAARYADLRDDRDRAVEDAKDELRSRRDEAEAIKTRLEHETAETKAESERQVQLHKDFVEHAKRQFHAVIEETEERHEGKLRTLEIDSANAVEAANKARHALLRENAPAAQVLKAATSDMQAEHHRLRDELGDTRQALERERERSAALAEQLAGKTDELERETGRAENSERLAATRAEKIAELEKIRGFLEGQHNETQATVEAKDRDIEADRHNKRRLDKLLETAGVKSRTLEDSLRRKTAECKRVSALLTECRSQLSGKDKALSRVEDQIATFLIKLRDPDLRPKESVVDDIKAVGALVRKVIDLTPKDVALKAADRGTLEPLEPAKVRVLRVTKKDPAYDQERRRVRRLRGDNNALLDELNELRFDRVSLRRKLRDAQLQLRFSTSKDQLLSPNSKQQLLSPHLQPIVSPNLGCAEDDDNKSAYVTQMADVVYDNSSANTLPSPS